MKLWSCVVACSLGSSAALVWSGMDSNPAQAPTLQGVRSSGEAFDGTWNATLVDSIFQTPRHAHGNSTFHHQGNI